MQKQVWDLTSSDFDRYPVWYFPTEDDPTCDEATVRPVTDPRGPDPHDAVLVAALFTDSSGRSYRGYLHWVEPPLLEHAQPVMFVDGECITFWFGITRPERGSLPRVEFPVRVASNNLGKLHTIELTIPGFAYLGTDGEPRYVRNEPDQL